MRSRNIFCKGEKRENLQSIMKIAPIPTEIGWKTIKTQPNNKNTTIIDRLSMIKKHINLNICIFRCITRRRGNVV